MEVQKMLNNKAELEIKIDKLICDFIKNSGLKHHHFKNITPITIDSYINGNTKIIGMDINFVL